MNFVVKWILPVFTFVLLVFLSWACAYLSGHELTPELKSWYIGAEFAFGLSALMIPIFTPMIANW